MGKSEKRANWINEMFKNQHRVSYAYILHDGSIFIAGMGVWLASKYIAMAERMIP